MSAKSLCPVWIALVLLAAGCVSTPVVTAPVVNPVAPPSPPPLAAPRPTTPEELMRGFVEAMAQGDLERARAYYLSAEEFDALFSWPGDADPRERFGQRIAMALQQHAEVLQGAQYVGLAETPSIIPLEAQQALAGLVVDRATRGIDMATAVVNVNGQERRVTLQGLVDAGGYWRVFGPTLEVR